MIFFKRKRVFDPLDLEIIDRVYEAAWAQIEARDFYRDASKMTNAKRRYVNRYSR